MHLYRLFGQEQTLCLCHRLEQRKFIFAKEKRKHNHKQIHQKKHNNRKESAAKTKRTQKTKKMHASQFLFIVFLLFCCFKFLVFKFCFVLFALVLLLKNHIPRAVGLTTLRQNGIWTPQPFVCISSSASFPPSLHWSLLPSWGPSWDHFNSRFVTFRLSPPLQEHFTRINIHPRLTNFFQTMVGKL